MKSIIFMAAVLMTFCLLNTTAFTQETRTFTITNRTGVIITDVSISYNDTFRWGPSLSAAPPLLKSGNSFTFTQRINRNACNFDVRYRAQDGRMYYLSNVNLCTGSAISLVLPTTKASTKAIYIK